MKLGVAPVVPMGMRIQDVHRPLNSLKYKSSEKNKATRN